MGLLRSFWRFLRRRFVLALIFLSSLTYFLAKTDRLPTFGGWLGGAEDVEEQMLALQKLTAHRHIHWLADDEPADGADGAAVANRTSIVEYCRNTKQGKTEVTDDRGYTCARSLLQSNGCCDAAAAQRFQCDACSAVNGCCATYEGCVSCCLRPEQKTSLLDVIQATSGHRLRHFMSVKDQFELCLLKCRTSSNSVHDENKYKSVYLKYCYMQEPSEPFQK